VICSINNMILLKQSGLGFGVFGGGFTSYCRFRSQVLFQDKYILNNLHMEECKDKGKHEKGSTPPSSSLFLTSKLCLH